MQRSLCALVTLAAAISGIRAQSAGQQKPNSDHMEHRFDDPAALSRRFDDPARDAWQLPDRIIEALALRSGQSVADIGAGTGYFSVRLARSAAAPKVFAVDIEPAMVKHLRERAAAEKLSNMVSVQAGKDSPDLPEPVNVVLVVNTYHHIADRVSYFRNLRRLLKPGGRVAIIDYRRDSPEGPPVEFRFSPEKFKAEMTQAGYAMSTAHDFLPRQHFLIFQVPNGRFPE
jgi:cyclopropane fatty-acyl-phospholipid synthase-like methyltransferase